MRAVPKSARPTSHTTHAPLRHRRSTSTSGTASPSGCSGGAGVEPRRRSGLRSASAPHIGSTSTSAMVRTRRRRPVGLTGEGAVMATNKEIVEGAYASFAQGDIPAALAAMDESIEWTEADGYLLAGTYVGPQAVLEGVFTRLGEVGDEFAIVPDQIIAEGDTVVALACFARHAGRRRLVPERCAHQARFGRCSRAEHRSVDRRPGHRRSSRPRRPGRAVGARPAGDGRVPQQPVRDRVDRRRRRLAPHRRSRLGGRRRVLLHRRPDQGAHQVQGIPGAARRARRAAAHTFRGD